MIRQEICKCRIFSVILFFKDSAGTSWNWGCEICDKAVGPVRLENNDGNNGQIIRLKGEFGLFEAGLYEVLVRSRCITCSREAERSTSREAKP